MSDGRFSGCLNPIGIKVPAQAQVQVPGSVFAVIECWYEIFRAGQADSSDSNPDQLSVRN